MMENFKGMSAAQIALGNNVETKVELLKSPYIYRMFDSEPLSYKERAIVCDEVSCIFDEVEKQVASLITPGRLADEEVRMILIKLVSVVSNISEKNKEVSRRMMDEHESRVDYARKHVFVENKE